VVRVRRQDQSLSLLWVQQPTTISQPKEDEFGPFECDKFSDGLHFIIAPLVVIESKTFHVFPIRNTWGVGVCACVCARASARK
jgi:hypothetical protein